MKEIILSRGQIVLVDDEDYERLNQYKWYPQHRGGDYGFCAVRSLKREKPNLKQGWTIKYMHREILNAKKGQSVDHINHDPLDNRKENLRICTHSQNLMNRRKDYNTASGYKGVYAVNKSNKWWSQIMYRGKNCYLGVFDTKEQAALAYNEAALKYHGEFASLNILEGIK